MIKHNERLSSAQEQGFTCITFLSLFVQNMLSADVSEVDVSHMHRTPNVTIYQQQLCVSEINIRTYVRLSYIDVINANIFVSEERHLYLHHNAYKECNLSVSLNRPFR